ncbi:hypothetical protein JCM4914_75080 [Streptomyces platensis subsp. malvinus]
MSDFYDRAGAVFGFSSGRVAWPYGLGAPSAALRRSDPELYEQRLTGQREKQEIVLEWAERYGLKKSESGCCPRWLTKKVSRQCRWESGECTHYGQAGEDRNWLDHMVSWVKEGRPAVLTSAPYSVSAEDEARLDWWMGADQRLRVARGAGWYGFWTTQVIMWRADRLSDVVPAHALAGRGAQRVPW